MDLKEKIYKLIDSDEYDRMKIEDIFTFLNLKNEDFKELVKIINELDDICYIYIDEEQYIYNASKENIYLGKIKKRLKYYASCILDDGTIINIDIKYLANAYDNDIVKIHLFDAENGEVINIVKHNMFELLACYKNNMFISETKHFPYKINVINEKEFKLVKEQIVLLHIDSYEGRTINCSIKKIVGNKNDPGMDMLNEIIKANVPYEFDDKVLNETNKLLKETEDITKELKDRQDYSDILTVTIDGLDAKDLDDAISLSFNDVGNYLLGVHIADVSYYVKEGSLIDKEAYNRGTSIYLANKVIPMLPFNLCNGICSLNENEIRLTMSCMMEIDNNGDVISYQIEPSYIRSNARLDYDDVNRLFNHEKCVKEYDADIKEMLFMMKNLSAILSKKMVNRGYLELDIKESKIVIDEKTNKVIDVHPYETGISQKMIENFMILANEVVASHIYYQDLPFIYRVHDRPSIEKLATLINVTSPYHINCNFNKNSNVNPLQLQAVLNEIKTKDQKEGLEQIFLRTLSKAEYATTNIGHFGLASEAYTHFTSPIRRYPDLLVHRFLKTYLKGDYNINLSNLDKTIDNVNMCERRADTLERDVDDIKKAEYMSNFISKTYIGVVTGVLEYGVFVALENTCEGLMRFENIPNFYNYNYEYVKSRFKLGSKVAVKVISCDISNGEINFAYVNKKIYN